MEEKRTHYLSAAVAIASIVFASVPSQTHAQETQQTTFQVLVDGTVAGSASAAAHLPTSAVVLHQDSSSSLPGKQVESTHEGEVALTSADPALISTIQSWMTTDNSGDKNTVVRKTVEIDKLAGSGATMRYRLSGAWPTALDAAPGGSTITMVYEQLEIIH